MERLESSGHVSSFAGEKDRPKTHKRLARIEIECGEISVTMPGGHVAFPGKSTMLVPADDLETVMAMVRSPEQHTEIERAKASFEDAISMELVDTFSHLNYDSDQVHAIHQRALADERLSEDDAAVERQREHLYRITGNSWQAEYYRNNRRKQVMPLLSVKVLERDIRFPEHQEATQATDGTINQLLSALVQKEIAPLVQSIQSKDAEIAQLKEQLEEATAPPKKGR